MDQKAISCKILLCEGPKSHVLGDIVMWRAEKPCYRKIMLCEGPKSYVLQCFAMLGTEKLSFAWFCYIKDRKAMLCKILLGKGQIS